MKRYLLGSDKLFYEFISSVQKEDSIWIITHTDLDGIASGIFLEKILNSKGLKVKSISFLDYSLDVLKPFFNKKFDFLFFTDWNVDNFKEDFEILKQKGKVFVIDHHPLNNALKDKSNIIKTDSKYCSAHTIFDLAKKENKFNTKDLEWLVSSAIIMDYTFDDDKNFKFLKSIYPDINKEKIFDSEAGRLGKKLANAIAYYSPNFKKIYNLILEKNFEKIEKADKIISEEIDFWKEKFKKEAEYFPEKKLYFYQGNPNYNISSAVVSQISYVDFPKDTLVFLSDRLDKNGFVKVSARNQTGKVNLKDLLINCIKGFENADVGGHVKASAGSFPKKYLKKFKSNLLTEL